MAMYGGFSVAGPTWVGPGFLSFCCFRLFLLLRWFSSGCQPVPDESSGRPGKKFLVGLSSHSLVHTVRALIQKPPGSERGPWVFGVSGKSAGFPTLPDLF